MFVFISLLVVICTATKNVDSSTYVDQTQSGDYNIHLDINDVNIIGVLKGEKQDYTDYDYTYDYSEMTIKPPKGSTKPPNATNKPESVAENAPLNVTNNNSSSETVQMSSVANTTTEASINSSASAVSEISETQQKLERSSSTSSPTVSKNCKKGFTLNESGDCVLHLQGSENALMKLVRLSQRLKTRRDSRIHRKRLI